MEENSSIGDSPSCATVPNNDAAIVDGIPRINIISNDEPLLDSGKLQDVDVSDVNPNSAESVNNDIEKFQPPGAVEAAASFDTPDIQLPPSGTPETSYLDPDDFLTPTEGTAKPFGESVCEGTPPTLTPALTPTPTDALEEDSEIHLKKEDGGSVTESGHVKSDDGSPCSGNEDNMPVTKESPLSNEQYFPRVPESLPDSGYKGETEDSEKGAGSFSKPLEASADEDDDNVDGNTEYFWEGGDTDLESLASDKDFLEFTDVSEEIDAITKDEQSLSEKETAPEMKEVEDDGDNNTKDVNSNMTKTGFDPDSLENIPKSAGLWNHREKIGIGNDGGDADSRNDLEDTESEPSNSSRTGSADQSLVGDGGAGLKRLALLPADNYSDAGSVTGNDFDEDDDDYLQSPTPTDDLLEQVNFTAEALSKELADSLEREKDISKQRAFAPTTSVRPAWKGFSPLSGVVGSVPTEEEAVASRVREEVAKVDGPKREADLADVFSSVVAGGRGEVEKPDYSHLLNKRELSHINAARERFGHSRSSNAADGRESVRSVSPDDTYQTIEDTIARDDANFWLRGGEEGEPTKLSARVREIVTKHLSREDLRPEADAMSRPSTLSLEEENRMLADELSRVEDLLSTSRAERDEMSIKYNALSEKVERLLRAHGGPDGDHGGMEPSTTSLLQQNLELRRRLEEEHSNYKKKLQTYQDGQQRQAQLIQKLQSKVMQYKQKCAELEANMGDYNVDLEEYKRHKSPYKSATREDLLGLPEYSDNKLREKLDFERMDLETALIKLEEEQSRCSSLAQVNTLLREQLDTATQANQSLTSDIQKLSVDWHRTREELDIKEVEWREEEQTFNDYFTAEHNRLLTLWREVVAFRRDFGDMKMATERDLSKLRTDFNKTSQNLCLACLNVFAHLSTSQAIDFMDKSIEEVLEMNPTELWHQIQDLTKQQAKVEAEKNELRGRIQEMNSQIDRMKYQLDEKEKMVASLKATIQNLEANKAQSLESCQQEMAAATRLREEVEFLQNTVRDIAQVVIDDADVLEGSEMPAEKSAVFRTSQFGVRSPLRSRGRSLSPHRPSPYRPQSPIFADSTISAVKAAFSKRQLQVHELQVKLGAAKEQLASMKRDQDDSKSDQKKLDNELRKVRDQLDNIKRDNENCVRERDRYRQALNTSGSERDGLEETRRILNEQIEALQQELERLQRQNTDLQRSNNELEEEKEILKNEVDKHKKETEHRGRVIESLEEKNLGLKEEIICLKESLNKIILDKDIMEQEKMEISAALNQIECKKGEIEVEIAKLKAEEDSLRDSLLKLQVLNEGLGQDKMDLNSVIEKLERDRQSIKSEKTELEQEKGNLHEEVLRLEQEKMVSESERNSLNEALHKSELNREKLELKISQYLRDNGELQNLLASEVRKKSALHDELTAVKVDAERKGDQLDRISKEKEFLARERSELTVRVNGLERENQSLGENLASLRSDKISLEMALYEAQQSVMMLETRKEQLESEAQNLNVKKETLQVQMNQLRKELETEIQKLNRSREALNLKLQQTEHEFRITMDKTKALHEDDLKRMADEKEALKAFLESTHQKAMDRQANDKGDILVAHEAKVEEMTRQMEQLKLDHEDSCLELEAEHKQNMELLEQEKAGVQDLLHNAQKEISDLENRLERSERDASLRSEQDRATIASVQDQLQNYKVQMEDTAAGHEKSLKDIKNQLSDAYHQRDLLHQEVADLKLQLKIVENTRDSTRKDLMETARKLSQEQDQLQQYKKEVADLKRWLTEVKHEKDALQKSNEELRAKVKRAETERMETKRSLEESKQRNSVLEETNLTITKEMSEMRSTLRDVEKSRLEARREMQDLRRQVQNKETGIAQKDQEIAELHTRIARDEEREDENRRDTYSLKQKLVETEASREALRKELANLQRKFAEQEDTNRLREKDLRLALEEAHQNINKLEETRRTLESRLAATSGCEDELRIKLSASQGQVAALEQQIVELEGTKRDVEKKLTTIHSSLRRFVGFRDRSVSPIRTSRSPPRWRSPPRVEVHGSPRKSPPRSSSQEATKLAAEIDPESVRIALREVMQQMAQTEKERDEANLQVKGLQHKLAETEEQQDQVEKRLQALQRTLGSAEQDKRGVDTRLTTAKNSIQLLEDTVQRGERDRKLLLEKITNLEQVKVSEADDTRQLMDKLATMKQNEVRQDTERRQLQEHLKQMESHCSKLEIAKRAVEGDLQRVHTALNDKETENQVLQERLDMHVRRIRELEDKVSSLQLNVDRLNLMLERATASEHELKDKVETLNRALSESSGSTHGLQERLQQLQKSLANSENERTVLQERLEAAKQTTNEAKKHCIYLQDRATQLEKELSNNEQRRIELESQMRSTEMLTKQREENDQENLKRIQNLQVEKQTLQDKLNNLQKGLTDLEVGRREMERTHIRLEKDKSALKKTLDKVEREKLLTEEVVTRAHQRAMFDRSYDQDNVELQRKNQTLEAQLAEQEQQHAQRLAEITSRHRQEKEMEMERLRSARTQAERTLESRERAHRQRVAGLEQQIQVLRDQLNQEIRKRQQYIMRSSKAGEEISELRDVLGESLRTVSRDPGLSPMLLEAESRKLDSTLDHHHRIGGGLTHPSPSRLSRSPLRRPVSSPRRTISTPLTRM